MENVRNMRCAPAVPPQGRNYPMKQLPSLFLCLLCTLSALGGCNNVPAPPKAALTETRSKATLAEGIDFSRENLPDFLSAVEGLSLREDWGRWSDANEAPSVKLTFAAPLPRKFQVLLTAYAFGENGRLPFAMRIGGVEKSFSVSSAGMRVVAVYFELPGPASQIEIIPPRPVSPRELGKSGDGRRLGIALALLRVEEKD